jgi:hypothetical protein
MALPFFSFSLCLFSWKSSTLDLDRSSLFGATNKEESPARIIGHSILLVEIKRLIALSLMTLSSRPAGVPSHATSRSSDHGRNPFELA